MVGTKAGHIKIVKAVVIIVANRNAHAPPNISHARLVGDVGKSPVAIVVIEGASRSLVRLQQFHGQGVD